MATDRTNSAAPGAPQMAALGDPTRRLIFESLSAQPSSVGDLAQSLPVTRSAVSQHLKVLRGAQLVLHRSEGTRHVYYIDPEGVAKLRAYLDRLWETALHEFEAAAKSRAKGKRT